MKKPPKISEEDKELFRQAIQGVRPLKAQHKAKVDTIKPPAKPRKPIERQGDTLSLEEAPQSEIRAEEYVFFARSGLQHKQIRKLRQGKLPIQASIDLHGLTRASAKQALEQFLNDCINQQYRHIQVIHGKGGHQKYVGSILKSSVYGWLSQCPDVLALCSCQAKDGGTGALYVLLRRQ